MMLVKTEEAREILKKHVVDFKYDDEKYAVSFNHLTSELTAKKLEGYNTVRGFTKETAEAAIAEFKDTYEDLRNMYKETIIIL